ncbi:Ku protein [Siccirubricoccus sp. KC 17139]|uniref:Non-homologous end joining protein Ku n=1 Tax=Siccirubricoccus soli TaxID=2899147 RepID=A0ABT1DDI9_9PROT|nr:Ku protein [Siccirubricoccus soli]MCO6419010.1 Ku protein [Siccirubricoccus soli]MCP2685145.1 Ku protein [Siccirubricoccus soli]
MAEHQHPIWRGHLRLALVSCPVALYSARHASAELHFHFINPKTGNRVRMVTLDAGTEEEVRRSDLVKGYEFKKDTYVLLDDADFERAKIDSSTVLTLDKFVAADAIDPIYYDASYYLVPDGEAGQDVYAVLREAIGKAGRVGLARLVIARRERSVAIMPLGRGLVLHTLNDPKELNEPEELFADLSGGKPDAAMVRLAMQLVERQTARFQPADMEDRYEARLREVIEAKLRGEEQPEPEEEPDRGNVIDLMTALKRSLGEAPKEKAPARRKSAGSRTGTRPAAARKAPARRRKA